MSTDKMREEFQEWVWNKYREVFWYDLDRDHVFKPYRDGFQTEFLNVRWEAWQASRAAIEVELPKPYESYGCMGEGMGEPDYSIAYEDAVEAIESLGLKVKP